MRTAIVALVVIVLAVGLLDSGAVDHTTTMITTAVAHVGTLVHTLLVAVAPVAVLIGGLIAVSPKHRALGIEVAAGGAIALIVAALGPQLLAWFVSLLTSGMNGVLT